MRNIIPFVAAVLICNTVMCGMVVPEDVMTIKEGDETKIVKVYELDKSEDPSELIEESFEQDGMVWDYEKIVQEDVVSNISKAVEKEVEFRTDTNKLDEIIKDIPGSVEYEMDDDGYVGELVLVPSSLETEAEGYAKSSYTVSDTKTYTDLAYNDASLVPQTVQKNGLTLKIQSISWSGNGGTGANGSLIPTSYNATVYYSAVGTSTYATGYITTARYSGNVSKTDSKVKYTVTYSGTEIPLDTSAEDSTDVGDTESGLSQTTVVLLVVGISVGALVIIMIIISIIVGNIKKRRGNGES